MRDKRLKIIIFSGTTEGRQLSEKLRELKIPHTVCVATPYGELMCTEDENVLIKEGRLNTEEMKELFSNGTQVVADATHPFALEVSANLKRAAKEKSTEYIRVLREVQDNPEYPDYVRLFDTMEECVKALNSIPGNLLFTTGSKDLDSIVKNIDDLSRVYVRVLPSISAIEACEKAGVRNDHIIAMHGPFSVAVNIAIMQQFDISCLISKESGRTGGLDEKLEACKDLGLPCFLIRRPVETEGVSVDEAKDLIEDLMQKDERYDDTVFKKAAGYQSKEKFEECFEVKVSVIGTGPGDPDFLTCEGMSAVKGSDILFGAERIIKPFDHPEKHKAYLPADIADILTEYINSRRFADLTRVNAAVLFSGDTGLYSGACGFEERLRSCLDGRLRNVNLSFSRIPGISSVSAFAAKLGVEYSDSLVLSLHKKNTPKDYVEAAADIAAASKIFVLFATGDDVSALAERLIPLCPDVVISLGERLSYPDEKITVLSPVEAQNIGGKGLYIAYIENDNPLKKRLLPYLEDDAFLRNKTPMTKDIIRHEVLRRLDLREGDVFYDVGSGTGSVSVEAALLSRSIKVFSFEMKQDAIAIQRENMERFGCLHIRIVEGEAPESFRDLEAPNRVFIGGSGGRLFDILDALESFQKPENREKKIRVVITAVSIETMCEIGRLASEKRYDDLSIVQIAASKAKELGAYHLMSGADPVMIASFDIV
ncbi:MAG: precorrin-6A reductase [Lachnospiraceae bacterium]|nr:precorrin-6A reductase [Lachnospiraceae bacterium]